MRTLLLIAIFCAVASPHKPKPEINRIDYRTQDFVGEWIASTTDTTTTFLITLKRNQSGKLAGTLHDTESIYAEILAWNLDPASGLIEGRLRFLANSEPQSFSILVEPGQLKKLQTAGPHNSLTNLVFIKTDRLEERIKTLRKWSPEW
jgi:hypothetical protein